MANNAITRAFERIKRDVRGAKILADWLGDGGRPVPQPLAQARTEICTKCPKNVVPHGTIEAKIAAAILEQTRIKTGMALGVTGERALKSCDVCGCHLPLKIWVPLENLDTAGFPDWCWITKESSETQKKTVTIQRKGAIGDVIAATIIADKLHALGYLVQFACVKSIHPVLWNHPSISKILEPDTLTPEVNLDGAYERFPNGKNRNFLDLYVETAARTMPRIPTKNNVPVLSLTKDERTMALEVLAPYQKPWVMVVPRSNAWPNRTVTQDVWNAFAQNMRGTCFWTGTDPCSNPLVPLTPCDIRTLMAYLATADVVVGVDTGPMHIASAFNRTMVVVEQAFNPELRFSDKVDFAVFDCGQPCSPCMDYVCKLKDVNVKHPPCERVNASELAKFVTRRANRCSVSAIIPVYGENRTRLERCVTAVAGQVQEIVVTMDGNSLTVRDERVIAVPSTGKRIGYGKTCNRGARHSTGEWLLMLNDDCYLAKDAVAKMLECAGDDVAVVGCLLRYPDGTIQHGGTVRHTGGAGFGHRDHRKTEASIKAHRAMEFVTFAAALVRREAFYQVHGFDEDFDCYGEDSDFCIRVRAAGWKVMYTPRAEGIHEESQSAGTAKSELFRVSNEIFERKWGKILRETPAMA